MYGLTRLQRGCPRPRLSYKINTSAEGVVSVIYHDRSCTAGLFKDVRDAMHRPET